MDRLDRMLALVRREIPDLRLVEKRDSPLMRAAAVLTYPLNPAFATDYTTVIGSTVYLPQPVDRVPRDQLAATLAHELVHQLDQRASPVWFYVSYGLLPLPVGRSRRAHWELRAYTVDLMLAHLRGESALERRVDWLAEIFSGPAYGWMWAGKAAAREFIAPAVAAVRAGTVQAQEPYRSILAAWRGTP